MSRRLVSLPKRLRGRLAKITGDFQKPLAASVARELCGMAARRPWARQALASVLRPGGAVEPCGMVFLCGCYNSGTTIVRDMIGSHGRFASMPREGVVYTSRLTSHTDGRWTRFWPSRDVIEASDAHDFDGLTGAALLRDWRLWVRPDRLFLEKSITNSTRMLRLQSLFPGARFVVMRREAEGVAEGIRRRTRPLVPVGREGGRPTLEDAFGQWRLCNAIIDEQIGHLEHVHEMHYEDLVDDPAKQLRDLFEFLGVPVRVEAIRGGVSIDGLAWQVFDGNRRSRRNLRDADLGTCGASSG